MANFNTNVKLFLDLKGARELARKMDTKPPFYYEPVRSGLGRLIEKAYRLVEPRVPVLTGHLVGSLKTKVNNLSAKITFDPIGSQGKGRGRRARRTEKDFRSGWALDTSDRYHYRGSGATTKGYYSNVRSLMEDDIIREADRMAKAIQWPS